MNIESEFEKIYEDDTNDECNWCEITNRRMNWNNLNKKDSAKMHGFRA